MTQNSGNLLSSYLKNYTLERSYPAQYAITASQGRWKFKPHLALINRALTGIAYGEILRLVITMPPRHGKSEFVSKYFPSWVIPKFDKKVVLTSYEADFASSWGQKARDVAVEWAPIIFNKEVHPDIRAAKHWAIRDSEGAMYTAGAGGPITGKGADVFIVDDPFKNAEDALSPTRRAKVWDWYQSTAYTRLEPGGAFIVIQTRWNEDDLAGKLLTEMENGGEKWTLLNLPAIAEKNDALGREPGEALWPERYSAERLKQIEQTVGSYWYNALYQQRPSPEEGNIFLRSWWSRFWNRASLPPSFERIVQSWDCNFKDKESSDFVVGQAWGVNKTDYYLLDQTRARMSFTDTLRAVERMKRIYPDTSEIFIEDKANGPAVINTLKSKIQGIIAVNPEGSKIARARAVTWLIEGGNIVLPDPLEKPWVKTYIDELAGFPNAANDDQVDATTQALSRLSLKHRARAVTRPRGW